MNIGYVKLDKLNKFSYIYRNLFKKIRIENNCYYLPSNNEKILNLVREKLKQDNIDYIVQEKDIDCGYEELSGKYITKYMLVEILDYCFKMLKKEAKLEEVYICVENFTKENIKIIEEICNKVKLVNIVTNHLKQFQELEKRLERNGIYITVSSNKRKALKRANIIINLDFKDFKGFNVNRKSIIINTSKNLEIGKDFEGICIEKALADTKRIMRIFSEMQNMDKQKLIEAELIKKEDYTKIRESVINNKLYISKLLGKRDEINTLEFTRINQKVRNESIA